MPKTFPPSLALLPALALLAFSPLQALEPETAVAQLKEAGVTVRGNGDQGYHVSFPRGNDDPPATEEQLQWVVALGNVGTLQLRDVPNEALAVLAPIADRVRNFSLSSRLLNDEGIGHVTVFQNVESLGLRTDQKNPSITVEGMRPRPWPSCPNSFPPPPRSISITPSG